MSRGTAPTTSPYAQPSDVQPPPAAAALYAQPSDVTLVKEFLQPWVTSGDTKAGRRGGTGASYARTPVHAADLYSADPEELARRFQPAVSSLEGGGAGDCTWYFLSPLRTRSPRDRRKVRAVADGAGCWHSEAGPKNVVDYLDGGRLVGYRQSFSFMRRSANGTDSRTGWVMAEFHLHQHEKDGAGKKVDGLVLCKMYRSPRNRGPAMAPDDDHHVRSSVSLPVETTSCQKSNAVTNADSNTAVTPRRRCHSKNSDGAATATTVIAPSDDEVSGTTTAAAPCYKNKPVAVHHEARKKPYSNNKVVVVDDEDSKKPSSNDKVVAVDDEDLLAPTRKKMRMAVMDSESSGAALTFKATAASAPAAAAQLHCPQCGFHLAALQALVTLTKSKSVVPRGYAGD